MCFEGLKKNKRGGVEKNNGAEIRRVNMGYKYDIQVTGIVGQVPEPTTLILPGLGSGGAGRFRKEVMEEEEVA